MFTLGMTTKHTNTATGIVKLDQDSTPDCNYLCTCHREDKIVTGHKVDGSALY